MGLSSGGRRGADLGWVERVRQQHPLLSHGEVDQCKGPQMKRRPEGAVNTARSLAPPCPPQPLEMRKRKEFELKGGIKDIPHTCRCMVVSVSCCCPNHYLFTLAIPVCN